MVGDELWVFRSPVSGYIGKRVQSQPKYGGSFSLPS